jgi:Flp pilus assembly protein TadG
MTKTTRTDVRLHARSESGQAYIEFAFVVMMLAVMLFGLIDFGRFIYEKQVMVNLSREGSNLASRGTNLSNTVAAVLASSSPLNLTIQGAGVIVTSVTNNGSGQVFVKAQLAGGGVSSAASKVGSVGSPATIPAVNTQLPPVNQTLYVTEVFTSFRSITPIGNLLKITLPKTNYDAAYFTGL